ncbi:MAG TPA: TolC family protein [Candidatus Polarisedimenticolaceae bacterium]|nr:TolC family protein [Candidatus Polarisedimenticolaceae bacterium]
MRVVAAILFATSLGHAADPPPANLAAMLAELDAANPDLLAGIARAQGAREVPERRQALPEPKLSVSYTNDSLDRLTLGSSEFSNVTVGWEQDVPRRSVRDAASGVAKADATIASLSVESMRARLRARVIGLYADLYRLDRTAAFLGETGEILATELAAARARYESGMGTQESLLRAQTAKRRLDVQLEETARDRRDVELELCATLGRDAGAAIGAAASLPSATLPADATSLANAGSDSSPFVREAAGRTARAEAALTEAKSAGKPELSWLAAYQYRGGLDPMVVGGISLRLPVWKSRDQARGIVQSEADLTAARHDRDAAALRARAETLAAVNDVASADRRLVLYREALIPEDVAGLEAARAQLSAGRSELGVVLDALNRLLADRRDATDLEAARLQTLARLEAATGTTIVEVTP